MYRYFELPYDFLNRDYTDKEKKDFDERIYHALSPHHVNEELNDKQKSLVDSWTKPHDEVTKEHDRVFGKGNERLEIPVEGETKKITSEDILSKPVSPLHTQLHNALNLHGYKITDYVGGYATKDGKNQVRIGSLLDKLQSNSPMLKNIGGEPTHLKTKPRYKVGEDGKHVRDENGNKIVEKPSTYMNLKSAFESDPIRASKSNLKMVITRNKYDVAGMSTDRPWISCMDMEDKREYNKHLQDDIRHGTLTAYLVHHNDNDINEPLARINLKRFDGDKGHTIFRPENREYGNPTPTFKDSVSKWAEKNYPMHDENKIYYKHKDLYDDDDHRNILNEIQYKNKSVDHVHGAVSDLLGSISASSTSFRRKSIDASNIYKKIISGLSEKQKNDLVNHSIHKLYNSNNGGDVKELHNEVLRKHFNVSSSESNEMYRHTSDEDLEKYINVVHEDMKNPMYVNEMKKR